MLGYYANHYSLVLSVRAFLFPGFQLIVLLSINGHVNYYISRPSEVATNPLGLFV